MQLQESKITPVTYDSTTKGKSDRVIIPTFVPNDLVRAIDVTELTASERQSMANLYEQYKQYRENAMSTLFNFETWVEHQTGEAIDVKWRAFKVSGLS